MLKHSNILAVDPGIHGAMAVLSHVYSEDYGHMVLLRSVRRLPTYLTKHTGGRARENLDLPALTGMIQSYAPGQKPTLAVVEQVGAAPGQGVTSMFRFGYAAGAVAGACVASGLSVAMIAPQKWQRWARKPAGKSGSLTHAKRLFPSQARLFTKSRAHNEADAVLIGYAYFSEVLRVIPYTK